MSLPKFLQKQETTVSRSRKQESKIARDLKGLTTINSGATFGQNDVISDFCEVEAKTTARDSFSFDIHIFNKLKRRLKAGKLPIVVVDFEKHKKSFAVITYDDLLYLINNINK